MSLMPHGYTLVGKGTTATLWPEIRREADVYQVLRACQSSAVPVFLGTLDLRKTFFMHPSTCIKHMLLLSYAGEPVDLSSFNSDKVLEEKKRSVREIRKHGVRYRNLLLGPSNSLWNSKLGRVQVVGFHRSELVNKTGLEWLWEVEETVVGGRWFTREEDSWCVKLLLSHFIEDISTWYYGIRC